MPAPHPQKKLIVAQIDLKLFERLRKVVFALRSSRTQAVRDSIKGWLEKKEPIALAKYPGLYDDPSVI